MNEIKLVRCGPLPFNYQLFIDGSKVDDVRMVLVDISVDRIPRVIYEQLVRDEHGEYMLNAQKNDVVSMYYHYDHNTESMKGEYMPSRAYMKAALQSEAEL